MTRLLLIAEDVTLAVPLEIHRAGDEVTIFVRGYDYTDRFLDIRDSLHALPARSVIIDAEIVLCETDGKPASKL